MFFIESVILRHVHWSCSSGCLPETDLMQWCILSAATVKLCLLHISHQSQVLCLSEQSVQETIYLLYLVCFSNEPLAVAFCLFPRYPPLHSHDFYKAIKPGLTWPPMNNVYMWCVCEGVARSFFTESSLRISEARKELWIQRPKEQKRHVQNFLPKRFQVTAYLGPFCVWKVTHILNYPEVLKTVRAPPPTPQQPQPGGQQRPLVFTGQW